MQIKAAFTASVLLQIDSNEDSGAHHTLPSPL